MNPDKLNFFKFLTSLDKNQLGKYFLMLGPEESEYVYNMVRDIGTQVNMAMAEFHDEVEDLAEAKSVLNSFTLLGKTK
jgi:hypothetical protein